MPNTLKLLFVIGLPIIVVTTLWSTVNFMFDQPSSELQTTPIEAAIEAAELEYINTDITSFSDEQICDKGLEGDPDVTDFVQEKIRRKLVCGWQNTLPSPACLKALISDSVQVPMSECLVEEHKITSSTQKRTVFGSLVREVELEMEEGSMNISYLPEFPTNMRERYWPVAIEVNRGGSGWFSYLEIFGLNNENQIAIFFKRPMGDRCNGGYAQWETITTGHMGSAYARKSATPFSLLNPLDETDWRNAFFASDFMSDDQNLLRKSLFDVAKVQPFNNWFPYHDVSHCAECCVGEILMRQSFIGDIFDGKDHEVEGVLLNMVKVARLQDSSLELDQCFALTLLNSEIPEDRTRNLSRGIKLVNISDWMKVRDRISANCSM